MGPNNMLGNTEAKVVKLCIQIEYITFYPLDDKLLLNGRGQGHFTYF